MKKVTLAQLGPNLPIGELIGGKLHKPFEMKSWGMDEELAIGKSRGQEDLSMVDFVNEILSTMLLSIGDESFEGMSHDEIILRIGKLFFSDVLYMYLWLRNDALGNEVHLKDVTCFDCRPKAKFDFIADIETLEVEIAETDVFEELIGSVQLRRGMMFQDEVRKELRIKPLRWTAMGNVVSGEVNIGAAKQALFKDAICGVDGIDHEIMVSDADLKSLKKIDIEILTGAAEKISMGPVMVVEGVHDKCKKKFKRNLDWTYDSFFAISSQ